MFQRVLDLKNKIQERSYFLFGPRQTGKTTYLRTIFPQARYINLNQADTFRDFLHAPERLRHSLKEDEKLIIIDEIQRLPDLLNEVQVILDNDAQMRFILTGSSARSLRAKGVNLLGGRARTVHLFPITYAESGKEFLEKRLQFGSLPQILNSSSPIEDLKGYVATYLQEEIRAEGAVRSLESFSKILDIAGLCSGRQLNFNDIGNDAQVPPRTVREYFHLLEDTLIAQMLPAFTATKKRKAMTSPKLYLFDLGLARYLSGDIASVPVNDKLGDALEHIIFQELSAYLSYNGSLDLLSYFRTYTKHEVDFIVGDSVAIEVKAKGRITQRDCEGLLIAQEEIPSLKRKIIVCKESEYLCLDNGIEVFPVEMFLQKLWNGEFFHQIILGQGMLS